MTGIETLKKTNSHDHTQAIIVRNNKVVSLEKRKGTKEMIKSVSRIKNQQGILIKLPKIYKRILND